MLIGLFRTVFFIIIFYYIFKFIARVVLPLFIANRVNHMRNQGNNLNDYANQKKKEEGKVTIQKGKPSQKITTEDMGEYVSYEEVK